MNNIFSGTFSRAGLIYDYSGVWSPQGAAISWKAIVRNADVVCRPSGTLSDGLTQEEIIEVITRLIELNIVETVEGQQSNPESARLAAGGASDRPRRHPTGITNDLSPRD